jgi:hypothetical protein
MERKWQPDVEMIAAQLIQDYRERRSMTRSSPRTIG